MYCSAASGEVVLLYGWFWLVAIAVPVARQGGAAGSRCWTQDVRCCFVIYSLRANSQSDWILSRSGRIYTDCRLTFCKLMLRMFRSPLWIFEYENEMWPFSSEVEFGDLFPGISSVIMHSVWRRQLKYMQYSPRRWHRFPLFFVNSW